MPWRLAVVNSTTRTTGFCARGWTMPPSDRPLVERELRCPVAHCRALGCGRRDEKLVIRIRYRLGDEVTAWGVCPLAKRYPIEFDLSKP
jgi:hypothetical protein